jgi:hypothetical protein
LGWSKCRQRQLYRRSVDHLHGCRFQPGNFQPAGRRCRDYRQRRFRSRAGTRHTRFRDTGTPGGSGPETCGARQEKAGPEPEPLSSTTFQVLVARFLLRRRRPSVTTANRGDNAPHAEAEWNSKLRTLTETQQERERRRQQDRQVLSDEQRAAILALAADFPRLWRDPNTPDRERKRMTRLLLEDVTLLRAESTHSCPRCTNMREIGR